MSEIRKTALAAKAAQRALSQATEEEKNRALYMISDAIEDSREKILSANAEDVRAARESEMSESLIDRLSLNEKRIHDMAQGVREVAELDDPTGKILEEIRRPSGLLIKKVSCPIGVIGIIYEARPNVTAEAASLTLKSGNAVVLRGSASALKSNIALTEVMRDALNKSSISPDVIALVRDVSHEGAKELMTMNDALDLLIPRGGAGLINRVVKESTVPVIRTGVGNCHVYIDSTADKNTAIELTVNSKTGRPSTCNAAETLLISKDYPDITGVLSALTNAGVTLHGCSKTCEIYPDALPATEEDYEKEYLCLEMCVKIVSGIDEAIEHISKYGTGHTELIITSSDENAERFMNEVDAASVNFNASTRFTDGGQFGFGAEMGISTQKLHARGPIGLKELTIYKYKVYGSGQVRK